MTKANILIVEDESIVAEDIRFSLESLGYEVCEICASGEEAIKAAGKYQPDLVLMDIKIRGSLDGIETSKRIWDQYSIPIIYLTAHSDQATLERAKWTRPFGYVLKPFEERELGVTVEIALSKRPLAPKLELPALESYSELQQLLTADAESESANKLSIQLTQPQNTASQTAEQDDLMVDILDIVTLIWVQQSERPDSLISLTADDCLAYRGLKQQKSGSGARGGYEDRWRREIANRLEQLALIQIGDQTRSESLIRLSPTDSAYSWQLGPALMLAESFYAQNKRTVLFSKRLLEYDPYRQKWEKRLGRWLSFQAATLKSSPADLIETLNLPIDHKNPLRTKERFELALDTLQRDGIISSWQYLNPEPSIIGKRGWLNLWLSWPLNIALSQTQTTGQSSDTPSRAIASSERHRSFGFIKHIRAERELSQAEVAAAIGVTQAQLSRIEAGGRVQPATVAKIKTWILEQL